MTYKIGNRVEGLVTGIQPYGAFVKLDENTQGLIHISELEHKYVKNITDFVQVGQKVKVVILDIDEYSQKVSLSIRALHDSPVHPFAKRKKTPRYGRRTGSDFEPIDQKLDQWIRDALKELKDKGH